jgi:hypothetical protein
MTGYSRVRIHRQLHTGQWLNTFFPEAKKRKPLKVGIFDDLKAAAPDVNRKMLRLALWMYTSPCELGHTAFQHLRATLMGGKWAEQHGVRNESVGGNDCPTLHVEYRPSSRHIHESP